MADGRPTPEQLRGRITRVIDAATTVDDQFYVLEITPDALAARLLAALSSELGELERLQAIADAAERVMHSLAAGPYRFYGPEIEALRGALGDTE